MRCKDCGEQFEVPEPEASLEVLEGKSGLPARLVLIGVPNACPECHNIRSVSKQPVEAEESTS